MICFVHSLRARERLYTVNLFISRRAIRQNGNYMETKRFSKNDSGFICANCGKEVLPMGSSSRNHCPFCLCSLHVDINPGDRANNCGGLLKPVSAYPDPKKGYIIVHKCTKCGAICRNKAAYNVAVQPDNMELIIKLTANVL